MVIWHGMYIYDWILRISTGIYDLSYAHPLNPTSIRERKKSLTNRRRLLKPTPPYYRRYKPYKEGKKEASQPKKPPEEAAVFWHLVCSISLESSAIDFTTQRRRG